jgi:hypothetical protein
MPRKILIPVEPLDLMHVKELLQLQLGHPVSDNQVRGHLKQVLLDFYESHMQKVRLTKRNLKRKLRERTNGG